MANQEQFDWMRVLLVDLRAENEQLRTLLEEASNLLSYAVEFEMYGRDAASRLSIDRAEEWERRYQALMQKREEK